MQTETAISTSAPKKRANNVDRHVGAKIRERRIMLGLTQHQVAEMVGCAMQQMNKRERGTNRVTAGNLFTIAQVLKVDVGYFYEGLDMSRTHKKTARERKLLELAKSFVGIKSPAHQDGLCNLARALSNA